MIILTPDIKKHINNFRFAKTICCKLSLSIGGANFLIPSIKVIFHKRFFSENVIRNVKRFLNFSKKYIILKTIIRFYICFLFALRSLFIKDSPYAFPLIALVLEIMHYTSITNLPHQSLYLITGFSLISYDNLCSILSRIFAEDCQLAAIYLVVPFYNKPLRRFISIKAFLFGHSPMSSTGRASIIAGAAVIGGTLFNSYLDRRAANARAEQDRQAANAQAELNRKATDEIHAKARAYQNYQDAQKEYHNMPFYKKKGEKPHWNESQWNEWSKTK